MYLMLGFQPSIGAELEKKEKFLCEASKKHDIAAKPITYDPTYTDNDATKNAGKFDDIYLDKIFIRGVIKDKRCVPIPNAYIEIWQEDEYGKKRYDRFSYSFADRYKLNMEQYSQFLGIATATSDNNGHFSFITVVPNVKLRSKKQPLINIVVSHEGFPKLESQIILKGKLSNADKRIVAVRALNGKMARLLPTYNLEIVLDGTNRYKTY